MKGLFLAVLLGVTLACSSKAHQVEWPKEARYELYQACRKEIGEEGAMPHAFCVCVVMETEKLVPWEQVEKNVKEHQTTDITKKVEAAADICVDRFQKALEKQKTEI